MNMIGHYYEGMQDVVSEDFGVVVECFYYHPCYCGLAEVIGAGAGFVEQRVHGGEGLAGGEGGGGEGATGWQAVVEMPGEEDGLVDFVEMGESAAVEGHVWE